MLQRKSACACGGGCPTCQSARSSLTISEPDDAYEQEADRVAGEVMRMPDGASGAHSGRFTEDDTLSRRAALPALLDTEEADLFSAVAHGTSGGGHALDTGTRTLMESRFGRDFGDVRIHTGAAADESARAVSAQAYTVGTDIVFGAGEYRPQSSAGQRLLAHELAHVVQQRGHGYAAHPVTRVSTADDAAGVQAEEAATRVMSMQDTRGVAPLSTPIVQRKPVPSTPPLTRAEEVKLSLTSPGEITVAPNPPTISLYNFAIDYATLKKEHLVALQMIAFLIKRFARGKLRIVANGHADSSGEDTVNDPLSEHRVQAVQKGLQHAAGVSIDPHSFGEHQPVATNDTIEGRSRNRRVDISFFSTGKKDDKDDDDGDGDGWPCSSPLGALICGIIACALVWEECLFCLLNLRTCFCLAFPPLCKHKPKPPEHQKKARKACPVSIKLPPKGPEVIDTNQPFVVYPFDMRVVFKQESSDKSPYCDCNCGEYRQYVSGFFERNGGQGPVKRQPHKLTGGKRLDPHVMQEDGPDPYGHRYEDPARSKVKPNRDKSTDPQGVHDKYVPSREDGCTYEGYDSPGFTYSALDEEIHIHLKFEAGPIDACNGDVRVGEWKTWEVKADRVPKSPPPSPPATGARGAGGGGGTFVPARPSSVTPTGRHPWLYLGGLPKDPKEFQNATIEIAFESQGERYWTRIKVEILVVSATEVTVRTRNSEPLNIAPEGDPQILVRPYSTETILR